MQESQTPKSSTSLSTMMNPGIQSIPTKLKSLEEKHDTTPNTNQSILNIPTTLQSLDALSVSESKVHAKHTATDSMHPFQQRQRTPSPTQTTMSPPVFPNIPTKLNCLDKKYVSEPSDMDVLCGNGIGPRAAFHSGNRILQEVVDRFRNEYLNTKTKQQKMKIIRHILHVMRKDYDSRFLGKDNAGRWYHMSDAAVRDKISGALRQDPNVRETAGVEHDMAQDKQIEPVAFDQVNDLGAIQDALVELHREKNDILESLLNFDGSR